MYKPKHFQLHELVSRIDFERYGAKCWELFDERLLITLDQLRETLNAPIIVNNWKLGGDFNWRGLRTAEYYGSAQKYADSRSQHKYGRACDMSVKGYTAAQARKFIIENKHKFPHISFIEDDVNWVHVDVRNCKAITLWSPNTGNSYVA